MNTYAALLRGVNVGGRAKLPMKELQPALASLGYTNVVTYIQSGNVVFSSQSKAVAKITASIEACIAETFGLTVAVMLRTPAELADLVTHNPFLAAGADPPTLHVTFLADAPAAAAIALLDPQRCLPDEFAVRGREIYLHTPNGIGRSRLGGDFFRRLGVPGTSRNWNTVTKLLELTKR